MSELSFNKYKSINCVELDVNVAKKSLSVYDGAVYLKVQLPIGKSSTNKDPVLYKKNGQELFTTEMILGMNLNLFQNLNTGILYARFLDYKSGVRTEWHIPYSGAEFFPLESLQMLKSATSYTYINWTFQVHYQYGISTYEISDLGILEEDSHLLKIGISTDF